MSSYDEVIEKDLELMWIIKRYCKVNPWVDEVFGRIVSKYPFRDIVLLLWIIFIIGLFEIGVHHFWVAFMNVIVAIALRTVIESKRPVEYDPRLKPLTEVSAESFGFPSIESYMSVVILGHLFISTRSLLILPFGVLVTAVIGFSRVYSNSRFPHQIVGSWLAGVLGLTLSSYCCEQMDFQNMRHFTHGACLAFALLIIGANVMLAMENNDSRLLYIPKKEFTRVIVEILDGSSASKSNTLTDNDQMISQQDDNEDSLNSPVSPQRSTYSPRTLAMQEAQQSQAFTSSSRRRRHIKSDSLYFLQKSLEDRENKQANAKAWNGSKFQKVSNIYGDEDFFSSDNSSDTNRSSR